MTIKEVETLTGITKANIRFYEKEGLLTPGRSSNNYREYSEDDVEHLRKIRIFRIMGFSVAQIHQLADHPQRAAVLMEARAGQIQKEVKELERVRQVCLEVRDSGWVRGSSLSVLISFLMVLPVLYGAVRTGIRAADPQLLEMKLEWKKKGKDIMKKDRIDRLCKARDMAYLFCFLCIVSMIMFPINQVLGIRLPEKFIQIWRLVITISPFPALLLGAVAAGKARWQVPDLNRILPDSGKPFMKKERDRGKLYERVCFLNQIGLTSLVLIPLNKALGIQLPLWVTCGWMAVIAGLAIAVMVLKNRG